MTTPRDDIAGLCERLRPWRSALDAVRASGNVQAYIDVVDAMCDKAAAQLDSLLKERDALGERVKEMTSLLAISEDLRRKVIDVAEQWQARAEALQARVKELENRAEVAEYKLAQAVNTVQPMLTARALRAEQERDTLARVMEDTATELGCEPNNETILEAIVGLQQERDEAYERLKPFAKVAATHPVTLLKMGILKEDRAAIRRLAAGPEKEG